ncbi:MAG: PaaI family thioesterase [Chitinophagaceae bacterium]|nr:PaaI family thioesterase [Oligoflexus sp.]
MSHFPADLNIDELNQSWLPKLDKSLGVKITAVRGDTLVSELTVTDLMLQPFGVMHGGVSCVLGESMGSVAGGMILKDPNLTVVGQSLYALHLRPVKLGMTLLIEASPQHIGKRTQIWDILLQDKETNKPTAKITLTLAVIEKSRNAPK